MAEVTSSSLVGPTILFRYLADSQQLMISHLDQFWTSEEKSWPVLQREMAGGEQGSEDQDSLQSLKVSRLKPLLCSGHRQLRVIQKGFSLGSPQKITSLRQWVTFSGGMDESSLRGRRGETKRGTDSEFFRGPRFQVCL